MTVDLEKIKELDEIVKVVTFQTGKNQTNIAEDLKITPETLSRILNGKPSDKVKRNLIDKLRGTFGKEISQFVAKYGSLNSSALGHPRPTDPESIAAALEELAQSVREMPYSKIPVSPAVSGRTAVAAAGKVVKKSIPASRGRSDKDQ